MAANGIVTSLSSSVAGSSPTSTVPTSGGGSVTASSVPVVAVDVASGAFHSCAVIDTGGVKCWGNGSPGVLGAGPTVSSSSVPVDVLGVDDASAVFAGGSTTCVIVSEGAVKCWGSNRSGQLGDGTTVDSDVPVTVTGLTQSAAMLAMGSRHVCALTNLGAVMCWGSNDDQRLGDPTFPEGSVSTTARVVAGLESGVTAIASSNDHTCAVVKGAAKCWGRNQYGALGGVSAGELVEVATLSTGVVGIGAGAIHSCALMDTNTVRCWGGGWGGGGLGRGPSVGDDPVPGPVVDLGDATSISVSFSQSCVTRVDAGVSCWGYDDGGSFANGVSNEWFSAPEVAIGYLDVSKITTGRNHTCALTIAGKVRCSGSSWNGALGAGNVGDQTQGIDVVGIDGTPEPSPMKFIFDPVATSCGSSSLGVSLSGGVNVTIDWGDGTFDVVESDGTTSHTYGDKSAHGISVLGTAGRFGTVSPGPACITEVRTWGTLGLTSLNGAFANMSNLKSVPADLPASVSDLGYAFSYAKAFNGDISKWDTSNVTNMQHMFEGASSFDQAIGSWDTSKVTDFSSMFAWTESFNKPLAAWDVSEAKNLSFMFLETKAFNQPLDDWDTRNVSSFGGIFWNAAVFDQPLSKWSFASARVAALWQFFQGGMSPKNFSTSLIGWASRPQNSGVMAYFSVEYEARASDAVATLKGYGWDIRGTSLQTSSTTTSSSTSTTTTSTVPTSTTLQTITTTSTTSTTTSTVPTTSTTLTPPTKTTLPPTTTTTLPPDPNYTVVLSCGEGSGTPPGDLGGVLGSVVRLPASASPCTPPSGYEYVGWRCIAVDVDPGGSFTISGDSICTARWNAIAVPPSPPTTRPAVSEPPPTTTPPTTTPPTTTPPAPTPPPTVIAEPSLDNAAQVAALNAALASPSASSDQVRSAVSDLLDVGVTSSQATSLASSPKVLESIDPKQATTVFKEVPVTKLDKAEEAALVTAVTAAPVAIKNAFEGAIDVYGAGLDSYVPVGSTIDVGDRRTVIAATTVVGTVAAAGAAAVGGLGGAAGGAGGAGLAVDAAAAAGAGAGVSVSRRLSRDMMRKHQKGAIDGAISEQNGGTMASKSSGFRRVCGVLARETAAISFTLAGSVVVLATLSGPTKKIAFIAMGTALLLHIIHVIVKDRAAQAALAAQDVPASDPITGRPEQQSA